MGIMSCFLKSVFLELLGTVYIDCHTGIKYQNAYASQCEQQIWALVHFLECILE